MVLLALAVTLPYFLQEGRIRRLPLGWLGLCLQIIAIDPQFTSAYDLLEEIWFIGSSLNQIASKCRCPFCSGSRSHRINFARTRFKPRSCIKISDTVVLGIPRSASSSCRVSHQSLSIATLTHLTFSDVLLVEGLPEHGSLSTDSRPSLRHSCHTFICTALIASSPKDFWIIQIVSLEECSSLMQNLMQICCSTHSVILDAIATQYTCSLNSVYCPHWLVQWSCHCSRMCIPSTLLGCRLTSVLCKLPSLYSQWLAFFWTDLICMCGVCEYTFVNVCVYLCCFLCPIDYFFLENPIFQLAPVLAVLSPCAPSEHLVQVLTHKRWKQMRALALTSAQGEELPSGVGVSVLSLGPWPCMISLSSLSRHNFIHERKPMLPSHRGSCEGLMRSQLLKPGT